MKKQISFLIFLIPFFVYSQHSGYNSSPLDYLWMNVGNSGISAGEAYYTSIAFNPYGEPFVAYQDMANSGKATVMKFNGNNWVNIGNPGFSAGACNFTCLAFSTTGIPYVAFWDNANSDKATVMRFDGNEWVNVGNEGFSAGKAYFTSLAFHPSGEPYVAYMDYVNPLSQKATVMKFDGTNWVNVGTPGFSAGDVYYTSLSFSPSGVPYVAFRDNANSGKATVMKFDGTNWMYVGNEGFSEGPVADVSLVCDPTGQPLIAFEDVANSRKATVMKFDGSNWVYVGQPGFSDGDIQYTSLAIGLTGEPFVAFQESLFKASIMKYNGAEWEYVGSPGFSSSYAEYTTLAFSPSNIPYVAYQDWTGMFLKATVMKYDSVFVGVGTNEPRDSELLLYPNPVTTSITLEINNNQYENKCIVITDVEGVKLFTTQSSERRVTIDVSNYPAGMYFIKVTTRDSNQVCKFYKN